MGRTPAGILLGFSYDMFTVSGAVLQMVRTCDQSGGIWCQSVYVTDTGAQGKRAQGRTGMACLSLLRLYAGGYEQRGFYPHVCAPYGVRVFVCDPAYRGVGEEKNGYEITVLEIFTAPGGRYVSGIFNAVLLFYFLVFYGCGFLSVSVVERKKTRELYPVCVQYGGIFFACLSDLSGLSGADVSRTARRTGDEQLF